MNKLWLFYRLHRLGFRARPEPDFVTQLEQRLFGKTQASRVLLPRLASVGLALILVLDAEHFLETSCGWQAPGSA